MRFYFDTEFIETDHRRATGSNLELLSIGMVAQDGRELYLCNRDADLEKASEWVRSNVFPHLPLIRYGGMGSKYKWDVHECGNHVLPELMIADRIRKFVGNVKPSFWAYYAAHDWVLLTRLYGSFAELPEGWPMYCNDLQQEVVRRGAQQTLPKMMGVQHHSLEDARWVKQGWEAVIGKSEEEYEGCEV